MHPIPGTFQTAPCYLNLILLKICCLGFFVALISVGSVLVCELVPVNSECSLSNALRWARIPAWTYTCLHPGFQDNLQILCNPDQDEEVTDEGEWMNRVITRLVQELSITTEKTKGLSSQKRFNSYLVLAQCDGWQVINRAKITAVSEGRI